jgi:hypothetical protein
MPRFVVFVVTRLTGATMAGVNFSLDAARRIAAAVRKVERTPQNLAGDRNPPHGTTTQFWAYLTGCDESGQYWSWLRLRPAANLPSAADAYTPLGDDRPLFELDQPTIFSENTAREANSNRRIEAGTVVQLSFIGYDSAGEPVYVFCYPVQPQDNFLPLHDHRDNLQASGGFAFSVYHPGTSLPQQNWRP